MVMIALCGWRETQAKSADQPARMIMSDGLMTTLARRQPETLGSLVAIRLTPKGLIKRHGQAVIDLIQRAARRPEWGWPQVIPRGSERWRTVQYLKCFTLFDGHIHQYAPHGAIKNPHRRPCPGQGLNSTRLGDQVGNLAFYYLLFVIVARYTGIGWAPDGSQ